MFSSKVYRVSFRTLWEALVLYAQFASTFAELFTSVAELERVLVARASLARALRTYAMAERSRLEALERYWKNTRNTRIHNERLYSILRYTSTRLTLVNSQFWHVLERRRSNWSCMSPSPSTSRIRFTRSQCSTTWRITLCLLLMNS